MSNKKIKKDIKLIINDIKMCPFNEHNYKILEKLKKPFKHLINDDEILDIGQRFDKDYEKSQ